MLKKINRKIVLYLFAISLSLLSGCSNMFFYPLTKYAITPDFFGLKYDNVWYFIDDNVRLHSWHIHSNVEKKATILLFHGNGQNISYHFYPLIWLLEEGFDIVIIGYKGYGSSTGSSKIPGVFEDLEAMTKWSNQNIEGKKIWIGQSLGAALSVSYLGQNQEQQSNFCSLVLDSGFAGYRSITREVMGRSWILFLFQYPVSWTMPDSSIDPINLIDNINIPTIFIHGENDRITDKHNSDILFESANDPKYYIRTQARHIASLNYDEYRKELLSKLHQYCDI